MAAYVLRNYRDVVFMNLAQLAAGTSPAAIVRFAVSLGFEGYPLYSRTRALGRLTQLDDLAAARGYLLGGRRAAEV